MAPKENNEAINLLSLDGGGVRGASSLVILDEIMRKIKDLHGLDEVPKPCDFFHMIAGTSTGGLIAIMLGRLRMSTHEALQEYDNCAAKIFSKENKKKWSITERFQATALQKAVEGLVEKRGMGERMWDPAAPEKGKAIVCVMPSQNIGQTRVVRTFPGDSGVDDQWDREITIWQAARATTAASSFFKPQKLGSGPTAQTYIDAAIGVNNPVVPLLKEAVQEFGTGRRLGCVVSIGTGTRDLKLGRALNGLKNGVRYYINLANTLKSTATDAEAAHHDLQLKLLPFPGSYFRFNVPEAAEQVKLHHYQKIPELKAMTTKYLENEEVTAQVREIAEGLQTDGFDHGLTLGLIHAPDKEQVVLSTAVGQRMGMSTSFFTGRGDILQKLDSIFCPRNTGGKPLRECLLYGMGGVGKTEIALKISEVLEDRFKYIFFIDGSMPSTIRQSYVQICKRYNLGNGSGEAMQNLAMDWIAGMTEEWLMIFDDCNLSDRQGHLPGRAKGNVIYTSRSVALRSGLLSDCVFEVTPFDEADAIELLLRASGTSSGSADMDSAKDLVQELGCLPIAIDKAAAAIRDGDWSLDEYLKEFRNRKVGIHEDPRFKDKHVENAAVYATLELSYHAIMARRKREGRSGAGRAATLAMKVLSLLSFYHHKEFPAWGVLRRAAQERAERDADVVLPLSDFMEPPDGDFDEMLRLTADGKWNQHYFGVGLTVLQNFSLIKMDVRRQYVSMHVLVHSWARHRMKPKEHLRYSLLAKIMVNEAVLLSEKNVEMIFTRSLAPHLGVCLGLQEGPISHDVYRAQLLMKLGWHYQLEKKFPDAEGTFLECLRFWKMDHGNHDWNAIHVLQRLGALYHEVGRLGDAELTYLEVIERLRERIRDCNAAMLESQDEQEPTSQREKTTAVPPMRVRGPLGVKLSKRLTDRPFKRSPGGGESQLSTDGVAKVEKVLVDRTAAVGITPPRVPDDRDALEFYQDLAHADLARVYMDQGRHNAGKGILVQVLHYLQEEHRMDQHSLGLLRIEHEVKALTEPGNSSFWNKRMNDMMDLAETDDFWETTAGYELMVAHANCALKNGYWERSYKVYCETLHLFQRIHGPYDKKVLEILRRMVDCMVEGDRCDKAIEIARDCVGRAERLYGELHKETVLALEKEYEAVFFQGLEETDEGVEILRRAFFGAERCLGLTHSTTKRIQNRLKRGTRTLKQPVSKLSPAEATMGRGGAGNHSLLQWQQTKTHLEELKVTLGPNHILVKRFSRIVGNGPPGSKEEYLGRLTACFGPHSSLTKRVQMEVEMARDEMARDAATGGEARRPRPAGYGLLVHLCICGKPAHAEGSKEKEQLGSDTPVLDDQDGETEEADAGIAMQVMDSEAPPPGGGEADLKPASSENGEGVEPPEGEVSVTDLDLRDEPIYMCGFYSGRL